MQCPECQFENREGAKFCNECGHKFDVACPECNASNRVGSIFCDECGRKLTVKPSPPPKELSLDEKLTRIQKYLPKGLTDKILSQKDRIEGERKQVTVLFCDMVGFTTLSDRIGPDGVYSIMNQVYEILIHKVHDYEGTVNEMTGDGIMALFGAPIALEDSSQRAIRSAMAIHREITGFSNRLKQEQDYNEPLKMRIGIHTGPVIVGTLGNDLRVEFKAVGDTVNIASRMEGLAEPGATYVTEEIFKLTEGFFRFEALGEKKIKGKAAPVKIFQVIAPSSRRTRFDVSAERGLTPFVGRKRELELMIDGFERCKTGKGQALSIVSEAGVGKSRLLYEFRKAIANENITFLEGKCLSYSSGIAYHPIIDLLKSNFNIINDDKDTEIKEKVKRELKILAIKEKLTLPYLLDLLSVKDSGIDKTIISPEEIKARILESLKQIVVKASEVRTLIIAIEDLHWIDRSSEESLKKLLKSISGARVFLIFTYRPDFVHTWGHRSYHSQVNLNRLSNRDTLTTVTHLLGTEKMDGDLEELILEKTEGVPFFIEEFIKSLKDLEIIERKDKGYHLVKDFQNISIPATIQDVIMARVDSLPEGAKRLLQIGSVVGRESNHELIRRVTDFPEEELLSYLSSLKDSELIFERGVYPNSTYIFKHALTQEVSYNSLLIKSRKEIHGKIAIAIEDLYRERLEEYFEILAHHCIQGENWQRAYRYNREAGLKALSSSDFERAQTYFEFSLDALNKLPSSKERIEQEIDLRFNMRVALFPLGRHEEWGNWVFGIESLANDINDDVSLANVYHLLSTLRWIQGEHKKAIEIGGKALDLAKKVNHFSYQVATMFHIGAYHFTVGDYLKSLEILQKVHERLTGDLAFELHGIAGFPSVLSRCFHILCNAEIGNFEKAEEIGRETIEIAEKAGQTFSLINAYGFVGMCYLRSGKVESALPFLEESWKLCHLLEARSLYSFTAASIGYAYILSNEPKRALNLLEEGTTGENLNASWCGISYPLTVLAEAYRMNGELDLAYETVHRGFQYADSRDERGWRAWAIHGMAQILADKSDTDKAKELYLHGLEQAHNLSMHPLVAHFHRGLSLLQLSLGQEKESQTENIKAREIYHSLGMNHWLF